MNREFSGEQKAQAVQPEGSSWHLFSLALWGTLALTCVSGIFLTVYYVPAFAQAFSAVERLNEQVPFGWLVRRAHGAGGSFLLILLFLCLLRSFIRGEYKSGSPAAWGGGVLALGLTAWVHFSGTFLPLSQEAFWGTASFLSTLSSIPLSGSFLAEFVRGGRELGGAALTRFYSMHIGFSAILFFLFLGRRRLEEKIADAGKASPGSGRVLLGALTAGLLLAAMTWGADWFTDPLREAADPMTNPDRVFSPWYFLFLEETLKFISGAYPFFTLTGILVVAALLLLLPYIDRNPEKSLLLRPVSLSLGAALILAVVYFTLVGTASARYGERVIVPDRVLSPAEVRGAQVFAQKNCAYCHQVFGGEGRREGPDMAVVRQRGRSAEWLQRFILNARLYQPGTTMPRYEIPLQDLEALGAYLLSLDERKEKFRAVARKEWLDFGPYLASPAGGEGK